MDALEKVRKGFEAHGCGKSVWRICSNCPYHEEDDPFFDPRITPNHDSELIEKSRKCMDNLLKDAYSLLKVQQPILLENPHKPYGLNTNANSPWISRCPKCGKKIEGKQTRFCKYCGQAVKWGG